MDDIDECGRLIGLILICGYCGVLIVIIILDMIWERFYEYFHHPLKGEFELWWFLSKLACLFPPKISRAINRCLDKFRLKMEKRNVTL